MTPEVIREARRLIYDLIFQGRATTKGGRTIEPKDEVFVTMLEKVAGRKIEDPDVPLTVEGFQPKQTYKEVSRALSPDQTPTRE